MTQIDVDDGYIQKIAGILKCKPQYDLKLFRTGKDVVHTALELVINNDLYDKKIDELNARIEMLENAVGNARKD